MSRCVICVFVLAAVALVTCGCGSADDEVSIAVAPVDEAPRVPPQAKLPPPGPAGGGLASLYPGDEKIELDPRVLFVEDFETGTVKEIGARWGELKNAAKSGLDADVHGASPGLKSWKIKENGHLYTHTRGVDTMYARFYVKFHPKHGYIHHFVHLVADRTPTPWPKGGAGTNPPGDAKFSTGIEPTGRWGKFQPPGVWNFYSYWHSKKAKWGAVFNGKQEPIEPGRWYCVEVMLKSNTPGQKDGEQAFWIDGEEYGRFGGIDWRTSDKLKINSFWLLYYNTEQAARHNKDPKPAERVMQVWFDDIVVATEYIGPVVGKAKTADGKKKARPSRSALQTPGLAIAQPGKVVFSEDFEGETKFKGYPGEIVTDGEGDDATKAFSFGPKGGEVWHTYSTPVKDSTTVRFRVKKLCDVDKLTVLIWSEELKDNVRRTIWPAKKGEWKQVEFRGIECRAGWGGSGKSLEGLPLDNIKIIFDGKEGDRVLIDDFEVRE